jgi:hypothetical protein
MPPRPWLSLALFPALFAIATCAVDRPVLEPASGQKALRFAILEDYDKGADLAAVNTDFDLFLELGVPEWRGSFGWDDYEPERGRYDFAWLHDFITLAEKRGITLRPYLAYTPEWAAGGHDSDGQAWNQPPRDQAAWGAFVGAMTTEVGHHTNVPSLEIYNEQNVTQWWEGTRGEYATTLRTAVQAIRRSERALGRATRLQVIAGGLVFPDLEWIEDVCVTRMDAPPFDILAIHAYPETWTPEGTTVENYFGDGFRESFIPGADRACGAKRIFVNETGYATVAGRTEQEQASWWARAIATFAAEPRVEAIGIYEIRDLAPDKPAIGDAPNYHLGLLTTDGRRKLAFSTVDLLTTLLGEQEIRVSPDAFTVERPSPAGEPHHRAFTRADGTRVLIVWNRTAAERVLVRARERGSVVEYGVDGRERARHTGEDPVELALEPGVPRIVVQRR